MKKKASTTKGLTKTEKNTVAPKVVKKVVKKESKLNDEQKAVFIIHLFDSIDYLEKMFLTLESISDLKQSKVIKPVVLTSLKEFSDKVYSTCSKSLSDPMVSQHVMSLIGKRYSTSLTNIHKILD